MRKVAKKAAPFVALSLLAGAIVLSEAGCGKTQYVTVASAQNQIPSVQQGYQRYTLGEGETSSVSHGISFKLKQVNASSKSAKFGMDFSAVAARRVASSSLGMEFILGEGNEVELTGGIKVKLVSVSASDNRVVFDVSVPADFVSPVSYEGKMSAFIGSSIAEEVDQNNFTPFAARLIQNPIRNEQYTELQNITPVGEVVSQNGMAVANVTSLAYEATFGNGGIPSYAKNDRVPVKFLGTDWIVSGLDPAAGIVKLAVEASYGIISVSDKLDAGDVQIQLADISVAIGPDNIHPAILNILDSTGLVLAQQQVNPGDTFTYHTSSGKDIKVHVYQTSPGFTADSKWAEMSVYSTELDLINGQNIDGINGRWNIQNTFNNDALTDIKLVSNGLRVMNEDDTVAVGGVAGFDFEFMGLNLVPQDYESLSIRVVDQTLSTVVGEVSGPMVQLSTGSSSFGLGSDKFDTFFYGLNDSSIYYKPQGSTDTNYTKASGVLPNVVAYSASEGSIAFGKLTTGDVEVMVNERARQSGAEDMHQFTVSNSGGAFRISGATYTPNPETANPITAEIAPALSERGSVLEDITSDSVTMKIAKEVANAEFRVTIQ